jgi:DNA-binding CsgD family transcriptional regulator
MAPPRSCATPGESIHTRNPSALDQLTSQMQRIAGLVADELTNAEIAARLFLSPEPSIITCGKCSPS